MEEVFLRIIIALCSSEMLQDTDIGKNCEKDSYSTENNPKSWLVGLHEIKVSMQLKK